LIRTWLGARLLPLVMHKTALQRHLLPESLRSATDEPPPCAGRDGHGFHALPGGDDEQRAARVRFIVSQYRHTLHPRRVSQARVATLCRLLDRCRRAGCEVILFVGPEHSAFRASASVLLSSHIPAILQGVAREYGVSLYDTRTWLPDESFADGHHASPDGAARLSERFEAEALRPRQLSRHYEASNSVRCASTHPASASR
jgi:hypothetical protein